MTFLPRRVPCQPVHYESRKEGGGGGGRLSGGGIKAKKIPSDTPGLHGQAVARHDHVLLVALKRLACRVDALGVEGARRARWARDGAVDKRHCRPVHQLVAEDGHVHREGTICVKLDAPQFLARLLQQRLLLLGQLVCRPRR